MHRLSPRLSCAALFAFTALTGCGAEAKTRPDESRDYELAVPALREARSAFAPEGTTPAGIELAGTTWQWRQAECSDGGKPELAERGLERRLRIQKTDGGLLLIADQRIAERDCEETIFDRVVIGVGSDEDMPASRIVGETRVRAPGGTCPEPIDETRPVELRTRDANLEVIVHRSDRWCRGFDARLVYTPVAPAPLEERALARHFIAYLNRRDARSLAQLYAEKASLVDPYTVTETGGSARVDGRIAIEQWWERAFQGVEWVAAKLTGVHLGAEDGLLVLDALYIDPRLEAPLPTKFKLLVAAGEIFESETTALRTTEDKPSKSATPAPGK